MFSKRFTFLAIFATVFAAAQAKQLDATFDLVRFKATDKQNMVELYCSVNGNSVIYKKVPGGFQASVALEVQAADSAGIRHFDKLLMKSPVVSDTAVFQPAFNLQKRIFLPNGNFNFSIKAKDANSTQAASNIELPLKVSYKKDAVQLSDIQLIDSYSKSSEKNDYTKNGYKLVSYVSNFYPKGLNKLSFYTEIYNAENVLGKEKPMVVFYRIIPTRDNLAKLTIAGQKVMKAAPANVLLQELDITTLASGNYDLFVEVRNEENKVVATQRRLIQRSNPLTINEEVALNAVAPDLKDTELPPAFASLDSTKFDLYLYSLKPISNTTEGAFIEKVAKNGSNFQKKSYLYNFWKKRDDENPERAWLEYKTRIEAVEKSFANQTFHGYETDQGRVYLQYGPPSKISDERTDVNRTSRNTDSRPYQIWQYYTLGDQRNRMFAFVEMNLGNSYTLLHSTAKGEVNNVAWRAQARYKYAGSKNPSGFDRDSEQGSHLDSEGNEKQTPGQRLPQNR
ncbi:GWxTD domain-containing protein [Adhaeribacter terreus]|uniref:GWxTD domain-containing protein n=1 Tax=Adhaeribacter terreus TaxID=529703 RepID=A0ABW0E9L6_9BACT